MKTTKKNFKEIERNGMMIDISKGRDALIVMEVFSDAKKMKLHEKISIGDHFLIRIQ